MLPHKHFLISCAAAVPFSLHHPEWILISGAVSAAIDTDVVILVLVKSRTEKSLGQFRNPLNIFTRFEPFMKTIFDTGVLKTAMKTHLAVSALMLAAGIFYFKSIVIPVTIGVMTHILSDVPNLRKLL